MGGHLPLFQTDVPGARTGRALPARSVFGNSLARDITDSLDMGQREAWRSAGNHILLHHVARLLRIPWRDTVRVVCEYTSRQLWG